MGNKGLCARPLAEGDEEAWDALAARHGCLFDSRRWTDIFGPSVIRLGLYDGGDNLRGGFCVWEGRRCGLRVLRNPPFTPQIGPFYEARAVNAAARTDEQRTVVDATAEYIASSPAAMVSLGLSTGISDCLPFYWRGWKVVPRYTYQIDLTLDEGTLLAALSKERRNDFHKAQRDALEVEAATEMGAMRELMIHTFNRQKMTVSLKTVDRILSSVPPGEGSYCFLTRAKGDPIAGVYIVHDSRTAYYLLGGYEDGAHHGAGALAMWHAILKAKELGLQVFDFEGSVIPPIERYFRGFGGRLIPYFTVNRAWLPVEVALKLVRRERF